MDAVILAATYLLALGIGLLAGRTRHRAEVERLTMQRNAARIAADEAQRELEFARLTDPCSIRWDTPQAEAGIDRLIAEIRSQDLLDRIHDFHRDRDIIDLRDGKDGAS